MSQGVLPPPVPPLDEPELPELPDEPELPELPEEPELPDAPELPDEPEPPELPEEPELPDEPELPKPPDEPAPPELPELPELLLPELLPAPELLLLLMPLELVPGLLADASPGPGSPDENDPHATAASETATPPSTTKRIVFIATSPGASIARY